jgi:POT family proton-dependent oligopeptide transporter
VEQYTETIPKVKVLKNGEKVITDRELTIQYIYNVYYWYFFPVSCFDIEARLTPWDLGW